MAGVLTVGYSTGTYDGLGDYISYRGIIIDYEILHMFLFLQFVHFYMRGFVLSRDSVALCTPPGTRYNSFHFYHFSQKIPSLDHFIAFEKESYDGSLLRFAAFPRSRVPQSVVPLLRCFVPRRKIATPK